MKIINSKITKDNLILISANNLENIINTCKNKEKLLKDVKVIALKNKVTDKLSDFPEEYLKFIEKDFNENSHVAVEMNIKEYTKIRNKKYKNVKDIEVDIDEKIKQIIDPIDNNETLVISERENKVFLPYTIDELEEYAKKYPAEYPSLQKVVKQEYMIPLNSLSKNPAQARFLETYYLIKNRERKNFIVAVIYGIIIVMKSQVNPAVIAACKNHNELEEYIRCLKENKLENFKYFKVLEDEKISV